MILDDDCADHLQSGVALSILHVVGHLIRARYEDIHRVGHRDAAGQVPVHPVLSARAQIDILNASFHHEGRVANEADDRRARVAHHDRTAGLSCRVPRRVGHVVNDDILAGLLDVDAVLHLHLAGQVALQRIHRLVSRIDKHLSHLEHHGQVALEAEHRRGRVLHDNFSGDRFRRIAVTVNRIISDPILARHHAIHRVVHAQ